MKSNRFVFPTLTIALTLAVALGAALFGDRVVAQPGNSGAVRYQISAYAGETPQGVHHGCYVIDTSTGQLWHARLGGLPEKVSAKLP